MKSPVRLAVAAVVATLGCLSQPTEAADLLPIVSAPALLEVSQKLPDHVEAGASVPIEVVVRNVSSSAVEEVAIKSTLPEGYDLQEASPAPARVNDTLSWTIGRLTAGEQRVIRFCLKPTRAGEGTALRHTVEAICQSRAVSVQTIPIARPSLTLTVVRPESLSTNVPAALHITIRNAGNAPARDVTLATLLSPGLTHPSGSDLEVPLGTIDSGQSRTIPLELTANRTGSVSARVSVESHGKTAASEEVHLIADDVRLRVTPRGPETLPEQFTGLFELVVRNEGAQIARQVSLTLVLPAELAFVRGSEQPEHDSVNHRIRWQLGDLRPGEQRNVLWNGLGVKPGEPVWSVQARAGPHACPALRCTTHVRSSASSSPAVSASDGRRVPP
jgi:hypothetical protein